ncbi:MAG: helix-turn-helix domain-containing protein [Acidimicrobiales bacterium]
MELHDRNLHQPIQPTERLVVSVAEAAALLGISRALGYELAARGELPTLRLGWRIVVPKVALLALLDMAPRTPLK